jgi:SLA1 homology domain 1, SHD1
MNARCFKCAFVMLGMALVNGAVAREWKEASGSVSREATFVAYRDGKVFVRLPDGREASAAMERFSAADQAYVRSATEVKPSITPAIAVVGKSPVPIQLANYQAGAAPPAALPQPAAGSAPADDDARAESEMRAKYGEKYVFRTFCSRFHIILHQDGVWPIIGTAHYALRYWTPPCCGCCCCPCCGPFYLSFLKVTHITRSWIEAEEVGGVSGIKLWRFWWVPNCCGEYKITYSRNGTDWYLYDYACRSQPK